MRYIELFEKGVVIDNLTKNAKFQNWFKGSKVVDSNGNPELVFHYSASEDHFDRFRSLSHFGTNNAAEERFDYFYDKHDTGTQVGFTVPCFLSIKKPMFIEDFQSSSNMLAYDLFVSNKNSFSFDDLYNVSSENFKKLLKEFRKKYPTNDNILYNIIDFLGDNAHSADFYDTKLIQVLEEKGYDGFCYINDVEDRGSMSWIIFHPNQVWRLFADKED